MTTQLARLGFRRSGPVVIAEIEGEIDMSNAGDLRSALIAQVAKDAVGLIVDLSRVTYLDSAAIHVLYELREQLAGRGLHMRLVVVDGAPIETALRLTGVPDAVPICATVADAEASLADS